MQMFEVILRLMTLDFGILENLSTDWDIVERETSSETRGDTYEITIYSKFLNLWCLGETNAT